MNKIEVKFLNGLGDKRWFAYLNGQMLRDRRGVGRGFKTEAGARKAAERSLKNV